MSVPDYERQHACCAQVQGTFGALHCAVLARTASAWILPVAAQPCHRDLLLEQPAKPAKARNRTCCAGPPHHPALRRPCKGSGDSSTWTWISLWCLRLTQPGCGPSWQSLRACVCAETPLRASQTLVSRSMSLALALAMPCWCHSSARQPLAGTHTSPCERH